MTEPWLTEQNPHRSEMERKRFGMCLRVTLCAAITIGLPLLCKSNPRLGNELWIMCLLFGICFSAWFLKRPWKEYREAYRMGCVRDALKAEFPDLHYDPLDGIPEMTILETGMIYTGDSVYMNDHIQARFNNIPLEESSLRIEEQRSSVDEDGKVRTYNVTIFTGRWMIFDFENPFRADVRIARKGIRGTAHKGTYGSGGYDTVFERTGVKLDSSAYKHFDVYFRNLQDNSGSVTPALMERIQALSKHTRGKLMLGFIGNRLHVVIDDKQCIFDPPRCVFLPVRGSRMVRNFRNEIETVTQFVSELQKNSYFFRRNEL